MDAQQMMDMMRTNWVWVPVWTPEDDAEPRIVYFRKEFTIDAGNVPKENVIRITADSRYKLYINGQFVQEGPQKALSLKEWYVDSADIAPFLKEGQNCAAVEVLRYPAANFSSSTPNSNDSLLRTNIPNLYIEDTNGPLDPRQPKDPSLVTLAGKSGWKCSINQEIAVVGEEGNPAPIHAQEDVEATPYYAGWKVAGYNDASWEDAKSYMFFDIPQSDAPGCLVDRKIPAQRHTEKRFAEAVCLRDPAGVKYSINQMKMGMALQAGYSEEEARKAATETKGLLPLLEGHEDILESYKDMLTADNRVIVPAHTTQIVEISAGVEECGYLEYAFIGGTDATVDTLCSECYAYPPAETEQTGMFAPPAAPLKGDRTDYKNGRLYGHTSHYRVSGYGTENAPETYEPYWFRTFRYIQLKITTAEEPLAITSFTYRETGYPLDVKTTFETSDPTFAPIWDISVRTLKRCMHETYFDCPFYEQLQYAMDGRSEILYTYATSADDRLARQAMEAFRLSQRPDGMTNSDYPTAKANPIPSFSICYLLMVHDHMMYFGDQKLVRHFLPSIDQVLALFDNHLTENGLVGHVGGPIMRDRYWSFIDWSTKWNQYGGVPDAIMKGSHSLTMESLLYLYGLQNAAELADFVGRRGLGDEYRQRAAQVKQAIQKNCFGTYRAADGSAHRLLQDGPGVDDYSVHCQIFGILTDVVTPEEGRDMLKATVGNPDLAQSSVSFMFYLFRALEKAGWYEETDHQWNLWRQMVTDHMTTCVENDTDARSDCHAWASLMCYEMPAVILGVRPAAPGFAKAHIAPEMGQLASASGEVITPKGFVHVEWKKTADGQCDLHYTLPEGMEAE